ncbi:MAG: threonine synthase [Ancrocorticia sp.]|uniref:threonine synthase n=1 Tax=Ancrocorticia sp. TaxID=2593684 RepID=UPI003F8E450A
MSLVVGDHFPQLSVEEDNRTMSASSQQRNTPASSVSSLTFQCTSCGHHEPTTTRTPSCPRCGGLWDLEYEPPRFDPTRIDTQEWSQFRYRRYMALDDESWRNITLGEGMTPIVRFNDDILLKMDYFMPTLSFKDRGAAALIAHCQAIGVDSVVQDSSGNAGNSVAAYCGRAGIACEIFVPEGTSPKKIAMIEAHGATVNVVPGSRDHCAQVCRSKVAEQGVYYANHVYNPFFYEGTKTYIYETFEQLGRIPRHILIPVGNGTLYLGAIYALEHLVSSGAIHEMPQIIAVQSEKCDPLLQAVERREPTPVTITPEPTIAEGIAIGEPMRGRQILALAKKHGVRFVHAPENDIMTARAELAAKGVYCEHTTAANLAAYRQYVREFGPTSDCLITMCGAGLKSDH